MNSHIVKNILSDTYSNASLLMKGNPNLRLGQSLMIALHDLDKNLYDKINGTVYDPFYSDIKIVAFETRIKELNN